MLTGNSISNPKFCFIYWISGGKGKSLALLDTAESEGLAHARLSFLIIRGEPERAPNTRDTGSGFICIYIYIYIYIFVCLWGDYFHEQRGKLPIANVGNGRQARVRTALKAKGNWQSKLYLQLPYKFNNYCVTRAQ